MVRLKKPARKLSLRKRFLALTSNEAVYVRSLEKRLFKLLTGLKQLRLSKQCKSHGISLAKAIAEEILRVITVPDVILPSLPSLRDSIESFTESECWNFFETRKEDLYRLLVNLKFDDKCILENRSVMSGEEVLLRGLYELVSGADQHEIIAIFKNDQTVVTDNLQWWYNGGYMHQSRDAIREKFGGNEQFGTFGFIDCNCLDTARSGGGPAEEGSDAARWHPLIQRAFYNGWKSVHGLKHQTVDNAFGMTMDLYGPYSLRKNDLKLLTFSNINGRLRDLQKGAPEQLTMYGDSIYPRLSHLKSSWRRGGDADWKKAENKAYTKVRISIEWNYGATGNLYGYLSNHSKLKLLSSNVVSKVFTVATILRNCHVEASPYASIIRSIPPSDLSRRLVTFPMSASLSVK
jgi:hypothetical protein